MNNETGLLHFLKNFPAWIVLFVLTLTFLGVYYQTGNDVFKEWVSLILTALFTALGMQRFSQSNDSTQKTDAVAENLQNLTDDEIESAVETLEGK